ncbi:Ku protein [Streptomyces echinatus]|uniref:Ku protein n=1 Tax=Streptomyces echinatus TaxID=67293 RepID=UPI0037B82217
MRAQRCCNERTGDEVDTTDIVKGFKVGEEEYVLVEPHELDDVAPGSSQSSSQRGSDPLEPVVGEVDAVAVQRRMDRY